MLLVVDTVISHERCSEIIGVVQSRSKHLCEHKVDQVYSYKGVVSSVTIISKRAKDISGLSSTYHE